MIEGPPGGNHHEESEISYDVVAAKIRALKEAHVEPSSDDARAKEVWDMVDKYADQTGAFEGTNFPESERVAKIWIENGWADDEFFRGKAEEDLMNELFRAQESGDTTLAAHLEEELKHLRG